MPEAIASRRARVRTCSTRSVNFFSSYGAALKTCTVRRAANASWATYNIIRQHLDLQPGKRFTDFGHISESFLCHIRKSLQVPAVEYLIKAAISGHIGMERKTDSDCTKRDGRDDSKHEKCEVRRYVQHSADLHAFQLAYD